MIVLRVLFDQVAQRCRAFLLDIQIPPPSDQRYSLGMLRLCLLAFPELLSDSAATRVYIIDLPVRASLSKIGHQFLAFTLDSALALS